MASIRLVKENWENFLEEGETRHLKEMAYVRDNESLKCLCSTYIIIIDNNMDVPCMFCKIVVKKLLEAGVVERLE